MYFHYWPVTTNVVSMGPIHSALFLPAFFGGRSFSTNRTLCGQVVHARLIALDDDQTTCEECRSALARLDPLGQLGYPGGNPVPSQAQWHERPM